MLLTPTLASMAAQRGFELTSLANTHPTIFNLVNDALQLFRRLLATNKSVQAAGWACEINFFNDMSYNAFAACEDQNVIGLSIGVLLRNHGFFSALLSHPEILPWIGDPSYEDPNQIDKFRFETVLSTNKWFAVAPKDHDRIRAAEWLAQVATLSIFLHEASHLLNGHCLLLRERIGLSVLEELDDRNPTPDALTDDDYKALEFDADASGVIQVLLMAQSGYSINSGTFPWMKKREGEDRWGSGANVSLLVLFAVSCQFMLFQQYEERTFGRPPKRHPLAKDRLLAIRSTIVSVMRQMYRDDHVVEIISLASILANRALNMLDGYSSRPENPVDFDSSDYSRIFVIFERWSILHPSLIQLKLGNTPILDARMGPSAPA